MTTEQMLQLLKPIMLDGTEKEGDKLYHIRWGEVTIDGVNLWRDYPIWVTHANSPHSFTADGFSITTDALPPLFKTNPYEWLAEQEKERVILIKNNNGVWCKRVLIKITNGRAVCWNLATTIEATKEQEGATAWEEWRELQTTITKEEALKMLAEKGVDTTNLIIE